MDRSIPESGGISTSRWPTASADPLESEIVSSFSSRSLPLLSVTFLELDCRPVVPGNAVATMVGCDWASSPLAAIFATTGVVDGNIPAGLIASPIKANSGRATVLEF